MVTPPRLSHALVLIALFAAIPGFASAGTEFHVKNCSNHAFQLDIALADWFKPADMHLAAHKSVTMNCMSSRCNLGITWAGLDDMGESFEHLFTDMKHGDYVLQMKTGHVTESGGPSNFCIKTFALKKGDSCDVFDENSTEYKHKLSNMIGYLESCD